MTGRGIDQILAVPGDPTLYESWAKSAIRYVELAERNHGAIPRRVKPEYVWGDALSVLDEAGGDARIINLETAVTDRGEPWVAKGIHYRMHPGNVDMFGVARIDCCDEAGVDIVHGHSSHHPIGIEIYHDRLILYGCGDLVNDYEGIGGHDETRPDLSILYLATHTHAGLKELEMIPMRRHRFRLERSERDDVTWLARTLTQASQPFGTKFENIEGGGRLRAFT
jgi:poly-gamma-glutamate capsule biosynthesis protein CapA/YwtB (metallophosphatase superfamily)